MEGIFSHSPSKRFILYTVCFLLGVAAASVLLEERRGFLGFVIALAVLLPPFFVFWRVRTVRTVLYCLMAIGLGAGRVNVALPMIDENHIAAKAGKNMSFSGWVAAEPDAREDSTRLIIETDAPYRGRVLVKTDRYPVFPYGTAVDVACKIDRPQNDTFRYDNYLKRLNIYALCNKPFVQAQQNAAPRGSRIMRALLVIKQKFHTVIAEHLPEPHASFLAGLLYGARSTIPQDLQTAFKRTGTSHIIAISGYNITIVTSLIMLMLVSILIPRKKAFWIAIIAVAAFVTLVGISASVVRAGIMGALVLAAKQMGRLSRPLPMLSAAALGMVIANPFVLLFDVGFQLSFLAVAGLIYLAPMISPFFKWLPKTLAQIMSETCAAILMTTPFMLYQFGQLSVIAPFANPLVLIAIPWIMLVGFIAAVVTFVVSPLGQIIFWVAWVLLSYVIGVVEFLAKLPFAAVEMHMPLWVTVLIYIVILWFLYRRKKNILPSLSQ